MVKNRLLNLIVIVKILNIDFINKYSYYKLWNGGRGGYSVLFDYHSPLSNNFSIAPPPQLFLSIKIYVYKKIYIPTK